MADELDYEVYQERKPLPRRRGRVGRLLLTVLILTLIAAGSTYGWLQYGRLLQPASLAPSPVAAAVPRNTVEAVALKDFQSLQQQTAQSLQSMAEAIAAQKAELARLSDQLSALAGRIDARQTAAAPPAPPAVPARPAVTAPRKRSATARAAGQGGAAGPISVGGAPLPTAPAPEGQ